MLSPVVTPFFKKRTGAHYMSALAVPDPPRLAGRTGPGEFGPGWLGMTGWAGKS